MTDMHLYKAGIADNLGYEGTLIVTQYSFAGSDINSGARYQEVANSLGADVLAMQAVGTGRRATGLEAWPATRPGRFLGMCALDYKQIYPYKQDYDYVVGWGDSARGANIMGMQLECDAFSRLLIRDGVNLKAPQRALSAWTNFGSYLIHDERDKPQDNSDMPLSRYDTLAGLRKLAMATAIGFTCILEASHYSKQLRSGYTKSAAETLALDTGLPMRVVNLTHSFTGSEDQARAFGRHLEQRRFNAITNSHGPGTAALHASVEEGYHSDLLKPGLAIRHLEQTLNLAT